MAVYVCLLSLWPFLSHSPLGMQQMPLNLSPLSAAARGVVTRCWYHCATYTESVLYSETRRLLNRPPKQAEQKNKVKPHQRKTTTPPKIFSVGLSESQCSQHEGQLVSNTFWFYPCYSDHFYSGSTCRNPFFLLREGSRWCLKSLFITGFCNLHLSSIWTTY